MAIQLDDLVARLRLDTSGLSSGLGSVSSTLESVGSKSTAVGRRMSLGITAPLVGIAAAGVNLAASFDKTMRMVAIATDGPTKALSDLALKMGKETVFSANDAADAMLELAKGGMTAAQIQGGVLASTMKLATVGGIGLTDASTVASTAMHQFGLSAKDSNSIVVALAGAANAGSASVASLSQGLGNVGGVAHSMGISLQETTGILSELDNAGLKGAEGGTALRSMLNGLTPTSKRATEMVAQLGLSFHDAQGNFRPMADIAQQLHDKLGGLTQATRAQALETIFGTYGQQAANTLMQGGADAVNKYTKAANDQTTTNKLAQAAMSGVSGAVERAKGSIETAALMIGQVLAPYVEQAAGIIEMLANRFASLPSSVQGIIIALGGVAAVIGPLLVGFGFVATAIAAIGLPVIGVVAGLALLGAALVAAYQHSAAFRAGVAQAFAAVSAVVTNQILPVVPQIREAFGRLVAVVVPIIRQIVGVFRANLPQIRSTVQSVFQSVRSIVASVMSIILSVIRITTVVISKLWQVFGSTILSTIRNVIPPLLQIVRGGFQILAGIFKTIAAVLRGDWSGAWDGIKQILRGAWTVIVGIVKAGWVLLKGAFTAGVKGAVAVVRTLPGLVIGALSGLATALYNAAVRAMASFAQGIRDKIGDAVSAVKDGLGKIAGMLPGSPVKEGPLTVLNNGYAGSQIMSMLADGITKGAVKPVAALRGVLDGLFNGIDRDLGPIESDVQQDVQTVFDRIETRYKAQGDAAAKRIRAHFAHVKAGLEHALKQAKKTDDKSDDKAVQAKLDALDGQEKKRLAGSAARYRALAKTARDAIGGITDNLRDNARKQDDLVEQIGRAKDKLDELKDTVKEFAASVKDSFTDFGNVVGAGVRTVGNTTTVTTANLLADLADRVKRARTFVADIRQAVAQGLNQASAQQILSAGVEGGLATVEAIAAGGVAAVTQINTMQAELTSLGASLGTDLSATFYGTGIDAAQAVVDGLYLDENGLNQLKRQALKLQGDLATVLGDIPATGKKAGHDAAEGVADGLADKEGRVTRAGRDMARWLVHGFRNELDMHSPSRRLFTQARLAAQGAVDGLDSMQGKVAAAGARLASAATFTPEALTGARLGAASLSQTATFTPAAAAPITVQVHIGNEEFKGYIRTEVGATLAPARTIARTGGF